ncbi:MAG: alanine--tRNA ligase [Bacilli bacterium]|nr:alanine--tRNA ligase [Bacilli bacterium]
MKKMTSNEIRNMWVDFFESKSHKLLPSASLIPVNDDSLLFIGAGVAVFKKYFDGSIVPDTKRIVSIQKCIRTTDIENVGVTKRHQTFFEMMGNFSIGDYFKEDAIEYAFELLTSKRWFAIDKNLLYVTVFPDDQEAIDKWLGVGMSEDHIIPLQENFWEIGEGPCGPDSEIFFDRGEKYDKDHTAFDKFLKDEEQERYIEIWNIVFSQFNSKKNTPRNKYKELPSKNIDTGAGLERWCLIFQNVDSNFDTDLFVPIIEHIEELSGILYESQKEFKVIADHIRTITFALADDASFENVGRGYVLRRLLRRSIRMGKHLNIEGPFLYKLVSDVVDIMKQFYPYLVKKRSDIEVRVLEEERLFLKTLDAGERRLKELIKNSKDGILSGEEAFKLYDTYGFPFELTLESLQELGYTTSKEEFDQYMKRQRDLAKKNKKLFTSMASQKKVLLDFKKDSTFVYGIYRLKSNVLAIFSKDHLEKKLDHDGYIALKRTCFYAESGGQISDTGMIVGKHFKARVINVFKAPNGQHIHKIKLLDGTIEVNDDCEIIVDKDKRKRIEANHSSVHLLQYALRQVISSDITQSGSYVDHEKLRFDFTYSGRIDDETIVKVEEFINKEISKNIIVSTEVMPLDKAKKIGAMALFSEKYSDMVRVVKIGKSIELCGGTHANTTSDIKQFAIYNFESKGSNTYRVEATTGDRIDPLLFSVIEPYNNDMMRLLLKAKEIINQAKKDHIQLDFDVEIDHSKPVSYKDIIFNKNELSYIQEEVKTLEKRYFERKEKTVLSNIDIYKEQIEDHGEFKTLIMQTNNIDIKLLKTIADSMIGHMKTGFVLFANIEDDGKVTFVSKSNCPIHAGNVVKKAAVLASGNGGGSATFAQGGGTNIENLSQMIEKIQKEINHEK